MSDTKYYETKAIVMAFYKALQAKRKYGDASIELMLRYLEDSLKKE